MVASDMSQALLYDKRGEVGWITFNRPQARNALTFAILRVLDLLFPSNKLP